MITSAVVISSCGGSETKPAPQKGFDTLQYEDPTPVVKDTTASLIDSLISISASTPTTADDSAALALKARLVADTLSVKISDSVKNEIHAAREYMRQKQQK